MGDNEFKGCCPLPKEISWREDCRLREQIVLNKSPNLNPKQHDRGADRIRYKMSFNGNHPRPLRVRRTRVCE